jgi:hypothetical protein
VRKDYRFDSEHGPVSFADLFGDKQTLVIYSYMFGPQRERPCPMCTSLLSAWDGEARMRPSMYSLAAMERFATSGAARWASRLPIPARIPVARPTSCRYGPFSIRRRKVEGSTGTRSSSTAGELNSSDGGEEGIAWRAATCPFRARPGARYPRFVAATVDRSKPAGIYIRRGGEGGIDSGLRPSPFGRRVRVVQNRLRRFCRTPFSISRVRIPASGLPQLSDRNRRELIGRLAEREGFEPSMGF